MFDPSVAQSVDSVIETKTLCQLVACIAQVPLRLLPLRFRLMSHTVHCYMVGSILIDLWLLRGEEHLQSIDAKWCSKLVCLSACSCVSRDCIHPLRLLEEKCSIKAQREVVITKVHQRLQQRCAVLRLCVDCRSSRVVRVNSRRSAVERLCRFKVSLSLCCFNSNNSDTITTVRRSAVSGG